MTGIPCRRCGQAGGDVTLLWRPDRSGRLEPYAAQCRQPCTVPPRPETRRPAAPGRPVAPVVVSASRPGKCGACPRDIAPGDKITSLSGSGYVHLECAPPEAPRPDRRERTRRQQPA